MDFVPAVDILVVILPIAYAWLVGVYGMAFFNANKAAIRLSTPSLISVVLLHMAYIGVRTAAFDHPPVTTVFEIMTLLAGCIAVAYMYIEMRTKSTGTGFFILSLALVFQVISSLFIRDLKDLDPILRSNLLGFHVTSALLGYTAISLSAVYGFLYLLLYWEIKSSRLGLIYSRLPSLETLEKMSHKSAIFGFFMLSIAILVGLFWLPRAVPEFSYLDPKLIGTLLIWVLYAVALGANRALGWQGRKTMALSVVAFAFVVLSMTVVNLFGTSFHSFH
jgi:ABC-type transport system involved in cytochrome c biogenesis permease subunit